MGQESDLDSTEVAYLAALGKAENPSETCGAVMGVSGPW